MSKRKNDSSQQQLFRSTFVPGRSGTGELFEEKLVVNRDPVECLGMTFENDEARCKVRRPGSGVRSQTRKIMWSCPAFPSHTTTPGRPTNRRPSIHANISRPPVDRQGRFRASPSTSNNYCTSRMCP